MSLNPHHHVLSILHYLRRSYPVLATQFAGIIRSEYVPLFDELAVPVPNRGVLSAYNHLRKCCYRPRFDHLLIKYCAWIMSTSTSKLWIRQSHSIPAPIEESNQHRAPASIGFEEVTGDVVDLG